MKTDIDKEDISCDNDVKSALSLIESSPSKPTVVCLCGSTKFKDAYVEAAKSETLQGKIVLSVGLFGHIEGIDMDGQIKEMLDVLHFKKIDLSDEILVLNVNGYIGQSTRREIAYAKFVGKSIRYLECDTKPKAKKIIVQPIIKPAVCEGWVAENNIIFNGHEEEVTVTGK